MSGWRVVLAGGETLAIVTDTEITYDRRTWHTAQHGFATTGSYVGHLAAILDLVGLHKWVVREVVPPGELTTAEAIAAERKRVADVLAEVERELKKRAATCDAIAQDCNARLRKLAETRPRDTASIADAEWTRDRVRGKANAYDHSVEIMRAEFATIGAGLE